MLVDGGATPACLALARKLCMADPGRRRIVQHPARATIGVSALRSFGLAEARGEFLAFLDADDVWLPGKMAAQVALLDAHADAVMVYGRTQMWFSWREAATQADFCYDLGVEPDRIVAGAEAMALLVRNEAQTPTTCNAMMRASAVAAVGGCEARFPGMFDDQVLFAKLYTRGPVYVSGALWARYRQRETSLSHVADHLAVARERVRFLGWLADWLRQVRWTDEAVARLLRAERRKARGNVARLLLKRLWGR
ncbi:MAG: glycosyltransferase [Proteobacteria bacterium]|nr:glycosyltransferase [Pseudomonadota bacterium]